jgi:hypothetical protein
MKLLELNIDGSLTRDAIRYVGEEFKINERINFKTFGLGHLRMKVCPSGIANQIETDRIQKIHFDWTKNGAAFRIRTSDKLYGLLLAIDDIIKLSLIKNPDYVYAFPFFPFWILLKLNVPFRIAKWFMLGRRWDRFIPGVCLIALEIQDNDPLILELEGYLWYDCISTFRNNRINEKLEIRDLRTWVTDNGIPFK